MASTGTSDDEVVRGRVRILLADDQAQTVAMLRLRLEAEYDIVGAVENGLTAIEAARSLRPDVFLTNVEMPILNGIAAAREIHEFLPDCRVIFYSSCGDPDTMAAAFAAGASGYLINDTARSLLSSIRAVVQHIWRREPYLISDFPLPDSPRGQTLAQYGAC